MRRSIIDHLVIVLPTLAAGAQLVERQLGVSMRQGGNHPRMSTHNLLLRFGDCFYLKVIAPDPLAPKPIRPKWFGLDKLKAQASPRLADWVACTEFLNAADEELQSAFGVIELMNRGELSWSISIHKHRSVNLFGFDTALQVITTLNQTTQ
jgi:hypothetical protein